jgi:hypothetical protein
MSYPRYTLNFIDTNKSPFKEQLQKANTAAGTPEVVEAVARIARDAVTNKAAIVVKGSHTHLQATSNGDVRVFLSHNNEVNDVEPTINVVIF